MQWNLLGSSGTPTISQVDTTSAVSATTQNGYASGQYQSFTIGSDGTVTVTYSNGQQQNVGQLALANVANLQGLSLLGDGDYATTLASGAAVIGPSGTSGLATMQDGALEASNVNIFVRIFRSDRCAAGFRSQRQIGDHVRHRNPGHHQYGSLEQNQGNRVLFSFFQGRRFLIGRRST